MGASPTSIQRVTVGIAVIVLLSKGIGFVREIIIADRFGTGIEYDVYLVAISVPIALFSLFGYAFGNLFIPQYGYAVASGDKKTGLAELWNNFNLSLLISIIVTGAIIIFAPRLIHIIAPGLKSQYVAQAALIARISSIVVVLGVLEAFFRSVLNAEKRFFFPSAGPALANIVVIVSILAFAGRLSTHAILYGVVLGYAAQVLLCAIPFIRTGMVRYFDSAIIRRHSDRFLGTAAAVLTVATALQLYTIVDRYFASSLQPGIISAIGYSILLVMLAVDIIAYAFSTAIFPYLTAAFAENDSQRSGYLVSRGICVSLLSALPATMLFWVFSEKLVILLFQRGAFNAQSVEYTSQLLKYFALSLAGQFLLMYMSRVYYAARRQIILVICILLALVAKIILAGLAVKAYGYIGLPISSALSYTIAALLLMALTGRFLAGIDWRRILLYFAKVLVATAAALVAARLTYRWLIVQQESFDRLLVLLPAAMGISLLVFGIIGYMANIPEIRQLVTIPKKRETPHVDQN
jgi:putative peptidoglycan lipid II flippase